MPHAPRAKATRFHYAPHTPYRVALDRPRPMPDYLSQLNPEQRIAVETVEEVLGA